jgi:hypothetical protein
MPPLFFLRVCIALTLLPGTLAVVPNLIEAQGGGARVQAKAREPAKEAIAEDTYEGGRSRIQRERDARTAREALGEGNVQKPGVEAAAEAIKKPANAAPHRPLIQDPVGRAATDLRGGGQLKANEAPGSERFLDPVQVQVTMSESGYEIRFENTGKVWHAADLPSAVGLVSEKGGLLGQNNLFRVELDQFSDLHAGAFAYDLQLEFDRSTLLKGQRVVASRSGGTYLRRRADTPLTFARARLIESYEVQGGALPSHEALVKVPRSTTRRAWIRLRFIASFREGFKVAHASVRQRLLDVLHSFTGPVTPAEAAKKIKEDLASTYGKDNILRVAIFWHNDLILARR